MFREESVSGEGVRGAGVSLLGTDGRKTARNTITGESLDCSTLYILLRK